MKLNLLFILLQTYYEGPLQPTGQIYGSFALKLSMNR